MEYHVDDETVRGLAQRMFGGHPIHEGHADNAIAIRDATPVAVEPEPEVLEVVEFQETQPPEEAGEEDEDPQPQKEDDGTSNA